MSYILEALRKADAERERGAVPDLHAQPQAGAPMLDEPDPRRGTRWLGPVLGAGLVLAGGLAWHFIRSDAPAVVAVAPVPRGAPDTAAPAAPVAMQGPQATAAQPTTGTAAPAVVAAPSSAALPAQARPAPPPQAPPAKPAPRPIPPVKTKPEAGRAAGTARSERVAPVQAPAAKRPESPARGDESKVASKTEAPAPAARLPALGALPEELRRLVPPLAVGGSMYSTQAERRMVILNGQVFQEGASLAPELLLEQIRPKSAVLSVRGQRFELPL